MVNLNPPCFNYITEALPRWHRNAGQRFYIKYSRLKISRKMNAGWVSIRYSQWMGCCLRARWPSNFQCILLKQNDAAASGWVLCINAPIIHPNMRRCTSICLHQPVPVSLRLNTYLLIAGHFYRTSGLPGARSMGPDVCHSLTHS